MASSDTSKVQVEGITDTIAVPVPDPVLTNGDTHAVFTLDDVLPHRQKSQPMSTGLAAFASADMFKSKACFDKPKANRWDHRITEESASRHGSSLKAAMKHIRPGMISLGGGLPSSDYFPFESVDIKIPVSPAFSERETASTGQVASAGKRDAATGKSQYDLTIALNYCQSTGSGQLLRFVTEHTEMVHNPPYSDWSVTMTAGSTAALDTSFRTFGRRGDYILTEEFSFSTAMETARPLGLNVLGVKIDSHGLRPDDLDRILSTWDPASHNNAPKPFLLYTVPTGQNPTGSTQPLERRKEIYAIAEKHDLYILEDEPYYFLQMEPYASGHIHSVPNPFTPIPIPTFLQALIPSYLSLDHSGRVLRLDSFSKIIAPGSRCGWLTGSDQVIERFIRAAEVSTQSPSGFSMVVLYKLLEDSWGHRGFLEWLMFIRAEYTRRRDIIVAACEEHLPREVCSWTPPMAGMFHWIRCDVEKHPLYRRRAVSNALTTQESTATATNGAVDHDHDHDHLMQLEERVFLAAVDAGVLCARGSWFRAQKGTDTELFLRTTFAAAPEDRIAEAIRRLGEAVRAEFGLDAGGGGVNGGKVNGHVVG